MLIKNLTSKQQKIKVREISGERREYEVYVEPAGVTELDKLAIIHPEDYKGIFDIEGCCQVKKILVEIHSETPVEIPSDTPSEIPTPVESSAEENEDESKDDEETPVEGSSEFVCDVCGAEFASARGLSTHKNKAHAE